MLSLRTESIICLYIILDFIIAFYLKGKYQGPYSDGKIHTYSQILFLTIPIILIYAIFGKSHVVENPNGVHKITWKEYRELKLQRSSRTEAE